MIGIRQVAAFALLVHGIAQAAPRTIEDLSATSFGLTKSAIPRKIDDLSGTAFGLITSGKAFGLITPAMPIGDPAEWFTNDDYPAEAMRTGSTGMVNLTVRVSETGNPSDCVVTESSGSQQLDDAACALMMARARFTPAHDANGHPVMDSFHRRIKWQMPESREIWTLDQIRFPAPTDSKILTPLAADHSMDAVVVQLKKLGLAFERKSVDLDTGTIPSSILEQINKLPATEPFIIPQPGVVTINVVTARKSIDNGTSGKRLPPPPAAITMTLTYDVDPAGKMSNCAVKGETPSWAGNTDELCKTMEKNNPIFAPDPMKQSRHISITTQIAVTVTKP